jgi:hypothetical protein
VALGEKENRMGDLEKIRRIVRENFWSKSDERIVFNDIGGFYAEPSRVAKDVWDVYSKNDVFAGTYWEDVGSISYPTDFKTSKYGDLYPASFENSYFKGSLEDAVRTIFFKFAILKSKKGVIEKNEIEDDIREADFNSIYGKKKTSAWGSDLPGPDPYSPGALGTAYLPEAKKSNRKNDDAEGIIYLPGTNGASIWPVQFPSFSGIPSEIWYVDEPNKWTIGKISSNGAFLFEDPTNPGGREIRLDVDSDDKVQAAVFIYLKHLQLRKGKKMPKSHTFVRKGNVSEGRKRTVVVKPLSDATREIMKGKITFKGAPSVYAIRQESPEISWWVYDGKKRIAIVNKYDFNEIFKKWKIYIRDEVGQSWDTIDFEDDDIKRAVSLAYLKWMEKYGIKKKKITGNDKKQLTESISRWPEHVQYPSLGDITALRQSEDAEWWAFMDADGGYIATYRINPDNLTKELKRAAERAYYTWMGIDKSQINEHGEYGGDIIDFSEYGVRVMRMDDEDPDSSFVVLDGQGDALGIINMGGTVFYYPKVFSGENASMERIYKVEFKNDVEGMVKFLLGTRGKYVGPSYGIIDEKTFEDIKNLKAVKTTQSPSKWKFYFLGSGKIGEYREGTKELWLRKTEKVPVRYEISPIETLSLENAARLAWLNWVTKFKK